MFGFAQTQPHDKKGGIDLRTENLKNGRIALVTDDCTFGADAVLLASFSAPFARGRSCDLGTGSGIIPLLWELPNGAAVDAVDCCETAVAVARAAVQQNELGGCITVWHQDWKNLELPRGTYDCVVCNPPYFAKNSGKVSASPARRLARHEGENTLSDVVAAASALLKRGAHFCFCHRPERLADVLFALREHGLEPKRLRWVHAKSDSAPFLFLCDAVKGGKPSLSVLPPLFIEECEPLCPAP